MLRPYTFSEIVVRSVGFSICGRTSAVETSSPGFFGMRRMLSVSGEPTGLIRSRSEMKSLNLKGTRCVAISVLSSRGHGGGVVVVGHEDPQLARNDIHRLALGQ